MLTMKIGKYRLSRIDMEAGSFTYGNRIALGQIFRDTEKSEYQRMKAAFIELYGWSPRLLPMRLRVREMRRITAGFSGWIEKEQQLLNYEPDADQLAAGVKDLAEKVGDMGTLKAIAKAYAQDPDAVLQWEYSKVFGILFTDLEEYKFDKRYNKVIDGKYRKHSRRGA